MIFRNAKKRWFSRFHNNVINVFCVFLLWCFLLHSWWLCWGICRVNTSKKLATRCGRFSHGKWGGSDGKNPNHRWNSQARWNIQRYVTLNTMPNMQLNIHFQRSEESLGIFFLQQLGFSMIPKKQLHVFHLWGGVQGFFGALPCSNASWTGRPSVARRRNRWKHGPCGDGPEEEVGNDSYWNCLPYLLNYPFSSAWTSSFASSSHGIICHLYTK